MIAIRLFPVTMSTRFSVAVHILALLAIAGSAHTHRTIIRSILSNLKGECL